MRIMHCSLRQLTSTVRMHGGFEIVKRVCIVYIERIDEEKANLKFFYVHQKCIQVELMLNFTRSHALVTTSLNQLPFRVGLQGVSH